MSFPAQAALTIQVNYSGEAQYQSAFDSAAATWQSLLTDYQDGLVASRSFGSSATIGQVLSGVDISASFGFVDGPGNTLGQAGYTAFAFDQSGFKLATNGTMEFDSADFGSLTSGQIDSLILHEMGHVLGFGTLWTDNGVYVNGSGEFTGSEATAVWQNDFSQTGTPDVELGGAMGTSNAHWNEPDGGGVLSGITDSLGRDMRDELMTGWLNPNAFISELTLASFRDIGFTAVNATAVPEPSAMLLLSVLGIAVGMRRRRVGP
ncbi:leishmanolysin-related zinc metalloendopeptidase [Rhodopirellula sp. P2]|uniref:leishmanolysin-related zinc metalloendopeptidase n=1 Tax=Rhodopirellula sp. P2 TaxID=2127060 RepID=UPI002367B281|nr:leishmanolysin-related zinc metalloendopeptidase [Rhodopirellula sp. P2]WDQ16949.1 leishmanolysin-related zinc metalloendopeptidase [Rhodopirellula sp. P2]